MKQQTMLCLAAQIQVEYRIGEGENVSNRTPSYAYTENSLNFSTTEIPGSDIATNQAQCCR